MQLVGRHYRSGNAIRIDIAEDRIASVEAMTETNEENMTDTLGHAALPLIAPSLFDLQINGYGGIWFCKEALTAEEVLQTLKPHYAFGVTRLCPTLITNSFEAIADGFDAIRDACEQEEWANAMVSGCHLEGPYISEIDGPRGAHPLEHVRSADWDEFEHWQEISGDRIRLVTLAAEADGAIPFIKQAVKNGIVIAIGHTAANSDQIAAAVDAGARLSTHLGNAAHGTIRRHPNYIWDQLADERLYASIISDGQHLPPSVLQTIVRAKTPEKTLITSDAAGLAGCEPGLYHEPFGDFEMLNDGRLVVAGQTQLLAGSSAHTADCVAHLLNVTDLSLAQVIDMASNQPAALLGFEEVHLRPGSRADLMAFHWRGPGSELDITATIANGTLQYRKEA